jgi:hypothetical protein
MPTQDVLAYVKAAACFLELPLDASQATRVADHLQRSAAMAALLDAYPLVPEDEPAALYCPAPFDAGAP